MWKPLPVRGASLRAAPGRRDACTVRLSVISTGRFNAKTEVGPGDDDPRLKLAPVGSMSAPEKQVIARLAPQPSLAPEQQYRLLPSGTADVIFSPRPEETCFVHQYDAVGRARRPMIAGKIEPRRAAHHRRQPERQPHVRPQR